MEPDSGLLSGDLPNPHDNQKATKRTSRVSQCYLSRDGYLLDDGGCLIELLGKDGRRGWFEGVAGTGALQDRQLGAGKIVRLVSKSKPFGTSFDNLELLMGPSTA